MKGRRPDPTAIKLLKGNPGRRPVNMREPKHATIDPTIPDELVAAVARGEWGRIVGTLGAGHVTVVDRAVLIAYCEKFAQWRALETAAAGQEFIIKAPSGYPIPNPAIGMANRALALMLKTAAELGITPSSRSRIAVQPGAADPAIAPDEFTKYQQQRKGRKRPA